jgi:undecaprenyl-diphosphatase
MEFGFDFIHQLADTSKILNGVAIFFAQYLPYVLSVFFVIALFTRKQWRDRLHLLFFTLLSLFLSVGLVKELINHFFITARPFVERGFTPLFNVYPGPSFPSGHALFFFTLATVIFLQMSARWGIVAYILAILIGIARVFAGVHYPLDIVGGAVIGLLVPLIVRAIIPNPMPREEFVEPKEDSSDIDSTPA